MELMLLLDENSTVPLYLQTADGLKRMIISGQLSIGAKLPSTRELSETLSISRCTASKAYEELSRQGYINTRAASGTYVSKADGETFNFSPETNSEQQEESETPKVQLSQFGRRIMLSNQIGSSDTELYPELNFSASSLELLPMAKWREMLSKSCRLLNE
ncbi:MAG: GntR family transcriptional regulator, partial [Candidatus Obscuribacterales bacterium]|nr:GntR family transcriptional regulator [Candidatus Obscuribacterales bacterium]